VLAENPRDDLADIHRPSWFRSNGTGAATKLQGVHRATAGLHEELRWPNLQDGVPDVHEVMRQEIMTRWLTPDLRSP
jgi:hypothetical protein